MGDSYPIPEGAEISYREFATRDNPTDVREEIALQRQLLRDMLDSVRVRTEDDVSGATSDIVEVLRLTLGELNVPAPHIVVLCKAFGDAARPRLSAHLRKEGDPRVWAAVRQQIASVAATAEKMERIQRGRKILVRIDVAVLTWLIRTFVLPFVPRERLRDLAALARKHGMEVEA